MTRVEELWERLARAALRRDRIGIDAYECPESDITGNVPSSLANNRYIDEILRAADEIQDEDPDISRILCEHACSLAQNTDPNSEGRGVLQFKTGLMSTIKQKLAKGEGGTIDRSQDITRLQEFYKLHREKNNVDKLWEDEMKLRKSGAFSGNLGELERKTLKRTKVFATLKVLAMVLERLSDAIPEERKRLMELDVAMTEDLIAYNIIPLDAPSVTNAIGSLAEVQASVSALKYFSGLPKLPADFSIPETRSPDILDFLHFVFGFQRDNVSNQREHVVHLLANEQSRLRIPEETEPKLDAAAVEGVFKKSLENYVKWCEYLCIQPVWSSLSAVSKEKKLLFISLYFLIWGEASNVRFLPECLCYIFHHMVREMDEVLRHQIAQPAKSCESKDGVSFLNQIICPLYEVLAAEAANNNNGQAPHSAWRNYDDFNEYFWSLRCFDLSWPWHEGKSFLQKPTSKSKDMLGRSHHQGKTLFVEHRTFLHLYHSFHRLWIFLVMTFQALTIVAFNNGSFNLKTLLEVLSLGPTFVVMKFIESVLNILIMYGAYSTSRRLAVSQIFLRLLWFSIASASITFLYVKALQEESKPNAERVMFRLYVIVIGIYGGVQLCLSILMHMPACRLLMNQCDRWPLVRLFKWMRQEQYYVGRGMYERTTDFIKYMLLWIIILGGKFAFAYFLQIKPLVGPTRLIVNMRERRYLWHDFVSKNSPNALTILSLWVPVVAIYILDVHVFYTVIMAIWSSLIGERDRLGEIRSLEAVHKLFKRFPGAFMDTLHVPLQERLGFSNWSSSQVVEKDKFDAARFSPFWNEIIASLREEDYITNLEMELLQMPKNKGNLPMVQWPLFLLASKIFRAKDIALERRDSHDKLWEHISRDDYMKYAVQECYHAIKLILMELLVGEGRMWVEKVFEDIQASIANNSILNDFQLNKLPLVITRVTALMGILKEPKTSELEKGAVKAVQDLYDVVHHDILFGDKRGQYETWNILVNAKNEGRLFTKLNWPKDPELKSQVKRLHSLLTIKDSASNIPVNVEARRRLQFFTNSLFMEMPTPKPVCQMLSFDVLTPYYSETVLYSMGELLKKNEDGIITLFYLQKIYPDEWKNFLARIGRDETEVDPESFSNPNDILALRFWASYRGQTLARTVRGMMHYRKALMLQTYLERGTYGDLEAAIPCTDATDTRGFDLSPEARAQVDLKFTYVVTCQIYGRQRKQQKPEATDIALLMQRNEALRVAYIDDIETLKDGKVHKEFYSKLVKADINGNDKEIYSIKLPGDPKLGEGKPENQNHAIVFTRGSVVQTIDMNQDNYFEEALKMRNLLEEFDRDHGIRPPTILGVREHVFTGSVSSLASFMSNQEASFVTLCQRVLAKPLKVRMHYGHPDVFDRVFHLTRGGISKASRVINISEDVFAGFNTTLRQGNVTHHEYIQVGKGRDGGLNQITLFERKIASGNGEQVLSRDVYRLGQLFDFFRMMSFYITTVGYYFCTMLMVLVVYIFLYGRAYVALFGVGETIEDRANITDITALSVALNTQFLIQIGGCTALPMILGFILEQGFFRATVSFITMQLQLCSMFFTFSLGTKAHYFGRTILHGGAKYHATGRGFVVSHIKFSENYRLYSRSHFVQGFEVVLLLVVCMAYGYSSGGSLAYIFVTLSSWFMAISWLFAPYLFNPSGFEWQKTVEDFWEWTKWLFYQGRIGVKGEESWEAWWDSELAHIKTIEGRIAETILKLRFFIFQYGIVYKLHVQGSIKSLSVYGFSWIVLAWLIVLFKVFTISQKMNVDFQFSLRFFQGLSFLLTLAGLAVAVAITDLSLPDVFACILAFIPTGWGILSIAAAWKPLIKKLGLWKSVCSIARLYDAGMGMLIFIPIAFLSWFPFVSTVQNRLMFSQAFSQGLKI